MQKFDVNKLRVASPCSIGWETMTGDERVRRCHACQLNIYNTAEMTASEVQTLIENREGRLCIRMYRRADGTVLTKDCPVGLRAVRKRISVFAGAAISSILGLFSISFAQKDWPPIRPTEIRTERTKSNTEYSQLSGTICDPDGAIIPHVNVKLFKNGEKKPMISVSNDDGLYMFEGLSEGLYRLEAKASGFKKKIKTNIKIEKRENVSMNVFVDTYDSTVVVGLFGFDERPAIDLGSTSITHTIYRRKD